MKRIKILLLLPTIFLFSSIFAQTRIAINGLDVISKSKITLFSFKPNSGQQVLQNVPSYCIDFFTNNKNFETIDRKNINIIDSERELQKSEDFIDGYMVEQGKSEGVDLILKAIYFEDKSILNIKIYDIAKGTVKCSQDSKLESNLLGFKNLEKQITYSLHELMWDCFETKFTVLRATDPKDLKAKEILVAIGTKQKIQKHDKVDIFELEPIEVDGATVNNRKILCKGEIDEVIDNNFSKIKTDGDRSKLADALAKNKKVYCTIINVFH